MLNQMKVPKLTLVLAVAASTLVGVAGIGLAADQTTIMGAGPGAGAFQMAGAMAEAVNRSKVGVTMTNRASPGFVANTRMVETGGSDFGMTNGIFVFSRERHSTIRMTLTRAYFGKRWRSFSTYFSRSC